MDSLLVDRLRRGEPEAAQALVDRWLDDVYRFLRHLTRDRHEAEELALKTLLRAVRGASRFDGRSGVRTWLHAIAYREFLAWRRGRRLFVARIGIPPVGRSWPDDFRHLAFPDPGPLPRYDLDAEKAEFRRLSRVGLRRAVVAGVSVKLVEAFQCRIVPGMPIFVVYQAGDPAGDREHPAEIVGLPPTGGLTTMRRAVPKILATVFPTGPATGGKIFHSLSVRLPVYRKPSEFVGYAEFEGVPVRQYSRELHSGLRDPSFQ